MMQTTNEAIHPWPFSSLNLVTWYRLGPLDAFGQFGFRVKWKGALGGPRSCSKMPTKNGKLKQINRIHRVTRAHC